MKKLITAVILSLTIICAVQASKVTSLDGTDWLISKDEDNIGREQGWGASVTGEASPTRVPGTVTEVYPGYRGASWYYKKFSVAKNAESGIRYHLRFWEADWRVTVYLNGKELITHETPEQMFTVDVTDALKSGENLLACRIFIPTADQKEGLEINEVPTHHYGGFYDSVELLESPTVRITDAHVIPNMRTGDVKVKVYLRNDGKDMYKGKITCSIAPARGQVVDEVSESATAAAGDSDAEFTLKVDNPKLWGIESPNLYTVRVESDFNDSTAKDTYTTNCGFREFLFDGSTFRLNGKRIYLKSNHIGEESPVGRIVPTTEEYTRGDFYRFKTMGFNCVRFIRGMPRRYLLDLADELGLMVYDECMASWLLGIGLKDTTRMGNEAMLTRWENETAAMILRDRNHPCVVIWGILNENVFDPIYNNALGCLPWVRELDQDRVCILNSGDFHVRGYTKSFKGEETMNNQGTSVPSVNFNNSDNVWNLADGHIPPRCISMHPSIDKDAVAVFTAPAAGSYPVTARFRGLCDKPTTSDVTITYGGQQLFKGFINVEGAKNSCEWSGNLNLNAGDKVYLSVGCHGEAWSDSTMIDFTIGDYVFAKGFDFYHNPCGPWSYGTSEKDKPETFALFTTVCDFANPPVYANPGDTQWRGDMDDMHPYRVLPQTKEVQDEFRFMNPRNVPIFVSEYGVGSPVDFARLTRHFEEIGYTDASDAKYYKNKYDRFVADWAKWNLDDTFATQETFFEDSINLMARDRLYGINAIRANPNVIGYSLTGGHDQGNSGEGIVTIFREPKKGTTDALFNAFYPCRICAFAEPMNAASDGEVEISGTLVNEDVLKPGTYPARVTISDENGKRIYDKTISYTVTGNNKGFVDGTFTEKVALKGVPEGKYRLRFDLTSGGAASGEEE
ncbi:MAG: glycoside hydrolase family 2, partial [Abditibacteriota bacterium]|nr:glycoside hydrolase family 2 [Abditibacteriota bacterium]